MDWIKISKKLAGSAKMVAIVERTGLGKETILGRLVVFWSWTDDHVKEDGLLNVTSVTTLVKLFGYEKDFWEALEDRRVTWLGNGPEGYFIPRWEEWFSKSAKVRQSNAEKQRAYRERQKAAKRVTNKGDTRNQNVTGGVTETGDQKRREEKRLEDKRVEQECCIPDSEGAPSVTSEGPAARGEVSDARGTAVPRASDTAVLRAAETAGATLTSDALKKLRTRIIEWPAVLELCKRILVALEANGRGPLDASDRLLVLKVSALRQAEAISENEFWDSAAAVKAQFSSVDPPRTSRFAYWHGVLASKLGDRQVLFNALLKNIAVPGELEQPRLPQPPAAAQPQGASV